MLARLKQLFNRNKQHYKLQPEPEEDEELEWLNEPQDPLDATAWDQYWNDHIKHGIGPPFFDMFCNDQILVTAVKANGIKTILCAGNGISQEPKALAEAGFQVVAVDLSSQATEIAKSFQFPERAFEHYCDPGMRRTGGQVEFMTGDLLDPRLCQGPFDLIMERRTAQLYFSQNLGAFMQALAARLDNNGIFFSHCHDGAWKPPRKPRHFTRSWFKRNGWTIWNGDSIKKPKGRVGWLEITTG